MSQSSQTKPPFHVTGPAELIACGQRLSTHVSKLGRSVYTTRMEAVMGLIRNTAIPAQHLSEVVEQLREASVKQPGDHWKRIRDLADFLKQEAAQDSAKKATESSAPEATTPDNEITPT